MARTTARASAPPPAERPRRSGWTGFGRGLGLGAAAGACSVIGVAVGFGISAAASGGGDAESAVLVAYAGLFVGTPIGAVVGGLLGALLGASGSEQGAPLAAALGAVLVWAVLVADRWPVATFDRVLVLSGFVMVGAIGWYTGRAFASASALDRAVPEPGVVPLDGQIDESGDQVGIVEA